MKRRKHSQIAFLFIVLIFVCLANVNAQETKWSLKLTGVVQVSTAPVSNWYTLDSYAYENESAANGLQGLSFGLDIGIEYMIIPEFGIEGSIGYIPTRIEGGTHHTSREIFCEPIKPISFLPVKMILHYYVSKSEKLNISIGPIVGIGLIGELDISPDIGKARHFNGKDELLYGGQICLNWKSSKSQWSFLTILRYMKTTYEVSEIGTGDLQMDLPMAPISLQFGVGYFL